jgi:hypothetical protein
VLLLLGGWELVVVWFWCCSLKSGRKCVCHIWLTWLWMLLLLLLLR